MPATRTRFPWRATLLATAALAALSVGARAADLPATPEGAQKIQDFIATYAGKPVAGAPAAVSVTPEGADYLVAVDIGALTAPMRTLGVSYDPAVLKFKVFQQDDGVWRIEQTDFPQLTSHSKRGAATVDASISVSGVKNVMLIDPAISWVRSVQWGADKASVRAHGPGIDETIDIEALQAAATTQPGADGALATNAQESAGAFALKMAVDPKAQNPQAAAGPFSVDGRADKLSATVALGGIKPRPLLDLWAFLVAHPSRPQLAAEEAKFKPLLTAALASALSVDESVALDKISVQTPKGAVSFDTAKMGVGVAAAGPASRFEEHFAATGLALPVELVPAAYRDLVPTSFDIGFKLSGLDLTAAGQEAIADMQLAGDGPLISKDDSARVGARLLASGPVMIDIPPSHIVAPRLDVSFQGQIRYLGGKPSGSVTLRMRNFDQTQAALAGLGPDAQKKMVPVLAMAKGLAKADGGALVWVGELGADGMIKVNGLPLGKAPL